MTTSLSSQPSLEASMLGCSAPMGRSRCRPNSSDQHEIRGAYLEAKPGSPVAQTVVLIRRRHGLLPPSWHGRLEAVVPNPMFAQNDQLIAPVIARGQAWGRVGFRGRARLA